MDPIAFYFDFISPYAYFGSTQIDQIAAKHGREVDWRPVLIGITIMKIMGIKPLTDTPMKADYLRHDGPRMAKIYGVPYKPHGLTGINSVAASRAFLWLKAQDPALAKAFAQRIFNRLWVDGHDITAADAVADEAAGFGVDRERLLAAIASGCWTIGSLTMRGTSLGRTPLDQFRDDIIHPFAGLDAAALIEARARQRGDHPMPIWAPFDRPAQVWSYARFHDAVARVTASP